MTRICYMISVLGALLCLIVFCLGAPIHRWEAIVAVVTAGLYAARLAVIDDE